MLKLSRDSASSGLPADHERTVQRDAQITRIQEIADAFLACLEHVQDAVRQIESLLATASDVDGRRAMSSAADQERIDGLIDAIDRSSADDVLSAGRSAISGGIELTIPSKGEMSAASLVLPAIQSNALGRDEVGGPLSSLRRGQANAPSAFGIGPARAIVRTCALQLQAIRDEVQTFVESAIEPARCELDIAAANLASADTLTHDAEFLTAAARLTPIDALSAAQVIKAPPSAKSVLRLRRPPPSDKSGF
jgi:hypothetical protein